MNKTFAIAMLAILSVFAVSFAAAGDLTNGMTVYFNDMELSYGSNYAGTVSDVVPVRVTFEGRVSESDVKVKVWIDGKDETSVQTGIFNLVEGSSYSKLLSLRLPESIKDTTKAVKLRVSITSDNSSLTDEYEEYQIVLQRESYNFRIDSVDYNSEVTAGQTFSVSTVIENIGMEELENGYVVVSIPELGVYAKGFFGDLVPVDDCGDDCDNTDTIQKTVYIKVPETAKSGVYEMTVKVYNGDAVVSTQKLISIKESATTSVVSAVKSKEVKAGETTTFDLIVVNSGDNIKVYNIKTVSGSDLKVEAPSVFTVGPASSKTIPVTVSVPRDTAKGVYTFSVEVDGKTEVFSVNVKSAGFSLSATALIIVLAIIFVVLLVVLIVLLARKDNKAAEETETSYY